MPSLLRLPQLALAALTSLAALTAQTTVSVPCAADNTLYFSATGSLSNGAGVGLFVGTTATGAIRRAVLRFDVAAALPANAKVLSATLSMNVAQTTAFLPVAMTGHRLLQSWGEGTSNALGGGGGGAPATTGDATWVHRFFGSSTWTTPGGDFVSAPSFTGGMPSFGPFTTDASAGAAADVQAWLANPTGNFGWLLKANDETIASTAHRIDSSEIATPATRPTLNVTYLLPGQNGTWGTGCAVGAGTFQAAWVGTPIGGQTMQIAKSAGPALSIGADFFTLSLNPAGAPLLPGCSVYLPLAEVIPGSAFLTDASGAGTSSLAIPTGFPGYLINCQAAVLTNNAVGFVLSNSALTVLQ